jgi:D-alanyl-D-alanine carboxypeptidase
MDLRVLKGIAAVAALASLPDGVPPGEASLVDCVGAEAEQSSFSGVVSVARPGGTTTYVHGDLGKAGGPPIGASARFNLGSASKMFTAVAVAQLVDAGKVGLNDPIGLGVKGLNPEAAAVTVRQLLTHSSGLGNFFSPDNLPAIEKARTVSELLPLVAQDKPSFAPGSRFQYSNTGFLLLGILIERVSGQSYGQYLDLHIFAPARMVASGLDPGPASTQAVGMTTMPAHGPLRSAPEAALHGNPAGGCYSTAPDLQRFFAALLNGQLTSAEMLKALSSPQIVVAKESPASPQVDYGLGFGVGATHGHRWFGHNGGAPGVNVETAAYPDDRTAVVVMSNRDPPAASNLFRKLRALLFEPDATKACAAKLVIPR